MPYAGEMAALATAALWAFTSIFFAEAGKQIGSFRVNNLRLVVAVAIYAVIMLFWHGQPWPDNVTQSQWLWLALSAVIGLVFGDGCGFKALVMIGPRLTTLFYATAPIFATVVAWIFLGERLRWIDAAGIGLTISGVMWVVMERQFRRSRANGLAADHPDSGSLFKGCLFGLGAASGQAIGLVIAKHAMTGAGAMVDPLDASFVRMACATAVIWLIAGFRGKWGSLFEAVRLPRAMGFTAAGAFVGPFLGVWMSLVAVRMIPTGIAATLNAMTPVLIIPLVIWYNKEKVGLRGWLGAIVAVAGVALLILG